MNNPILLITIIVILIGMVVGVLIVGLIYIQQRRQVVDSLIRINHIVGCLATVEVPLNQHSPGKVRVNIKGNQIDFVAFTDEIQQFNQGDAVVILRINANKVWVAGV